MKKLVLLIVVTILITSCKSNPFQKQHYTHFSHSSNKSKPVLIKQNSNETVSIDVKPEVVLFSDTLLLSGKKIRENTITIRETIEKKRSPKNKKRSTFAQPVCSLLQLNDAVVSLDSVDPVGIGGISNAGFNFFNLVADIYTILAGIVIILMIIYLGLLLFGPYIF